MKQFSLYVAAATLLAALFATTSIRGDEGRMPELDGAVGWINTAPLSSKALRGKVVLVNFWTYSCINSLRELPYMKAWAAKYKDAGLVVLGVHAPEFGFEKDSANVKTAVSELNIGYPVPIDSNHSVWNAFRNQYWPADYIIDGRGRIRYHHFGEGEYDRSEREIQRLLRENGAAGFDDGLVHIAAEGPEAPPSNRVRSPETYAGFARTANFASREPMAVNSRRSFTIPSRLELNQWALGGTWHTGEERTTLHSAPGRMVFRFHSRDLHMVLAPAKNGAQIRFRIRLNGAVPGNDHGSDSGPDGSGEIRQPRMYQLIRQKGPVQDATFEIEFLDPGVEAFSFTFG